MPEQAPDSPEVPPQSRGWELACEGILRTKFGRRPSYALGHAMARLAAAETRAVQSPARWWLRIRQPSAFAFGVVSVLVLGLGGWLWWQARPSADGRALLRDVCTVLAARDVQWTAASRQPKVGEVLSGGLLSLESGLLELDFAMGAKVAIEGPARIELTGANSLELRQGKVAADVPRAARGFTVQTSLARVIDLGTRFGVSVNAESASRVDVFEGRVALTPGRDAATAENVRQLTRHMAMTIDQRGATTTAPLPERAYPQPNRTVSARPQNCGFDVKKGAAVLGGLPAGFGSWSGPAYLLTPPIQGITPPEGPGMLRFLDPPRRTGSSAAPADSEVWQLIDLRHHRELLGGGDVELRSFAWFNRTRGDARAPARFGLTVAAFRGTPAEAESLWKRRPETAVAMADQELVADDDPATWEKIELSTKLPSAADFLVLEVRAVRPDKSPGTSPVFAGHFADWVDVYLNVPLRGSVASGQ